MAAACLLGGALTFIGCAEAPLVPAATPATAPKPAGDLGAAKTSLEKAVVELKTKNYAGALINVDAAGKEISAAATNANLPAPIKETLATAGANLEPLRALIKRQDASAEKGLLASIASLSKLAELTKLLSGSGALGEMMKGTATTATADKSKKEAGQMMPKKP